MKFYCVYCTQQIQAEEERTERSVKFNCPKCSRTIAEQMLLREVVRDDKEEAEDPTCRSPYGYDGD